MIAVVKSHIEAVKVLVDNGASLSRANKDGWTAFHIAARSSYTISFILILTTQTA